MNHKKSGIYKGVSEAVYPDDILSDQELMGADLATIGAWCGKVLTAMWRAKPKTGTITDTIEGYARFWGCDVTEVERIIGVINARKIGTVSRPCPGKVTLTCRRLSRRHNAAEAARLRKQSQRERGQGHKDVTPQKTGPSSPYPFPYPSPSSVPVDVDNKIPASSSEIMELNALVNQFVKKSDWVGNTKPVYDHLQPLVEQGLDVSAAIEQHVVRKMKPWELANILDPPPTANGSGGNMHNRQVLQKMAADEERRKRQNDNQ